MALNDVIFDDVKFSDILKEIHNKCNDKNKQIEQLINDLKKFIKKLDDATVIAPLIKEYLDVDVKNNEHIVKLAAIIQRVLSTYTTKEDGTSSIDSSMPTEEEKKNFVKIVCSELKNLDIDIDRNILGK